MQKPFKIILRQKGAALILLTFIIGLCAITYLLHMLDPERLRLEQDKRTMQALNEAKQALIAWSASHSTHPGQMPFPDRGTGGGYDGFSDCPPVWSSFTSASYSLLIGELPIYGQSNPCVSPQTGIGGDFQDAQGNRLWYAVSRNLVYDYEHDEVSIINPEMINPNPLTGAYDSPPYLRQGGTTAYPWLKVLDRNGALISDRVAAVIIAPNNPLDNQNRTATAGANQFLDTFKIGTNTYSNADYTKADEDFLMGDDYRNVSASDTTFVQPYHFNDKLVYITIDELITALTNRAGAEAKNLLNQYKAKTGQFPYAADLGVTLGNNVSVPLQQKGMLPIDVTDTCTCNTFQSCTCSFNIITSVTFTKNTGTWSSNTGLCSRSGNQCTCTGAGSCTRTTRNFTCDTAGNCTTNQTGTNLFTYNIPSYADAIPDYSGCFLSGSNPACSSAGTFSIGLKEAAWFKENLWQDYLYYEWDSTPNLQVGGKTGINALLIGTGQTIGTQARPSAFIADYLDSIENTNGDNIFDSTTTPKNSTYNDQTIIVAP